VDSSDPEYYCPKAHKDRCPFFYIIPLALYNSILVSLNRDFQVEAQKETVT